MIFVSAGTGFAPMRAFLCERLAPRRAGVRLAEAALFNGIRSTSLDYIYRDEIEQFAAAGVLDHVHVAASRERPGRRDYVQDRIREQGALVWRLLTAGGYVYVCGSQPMRARRSRRLHRRRRGTWVAAPRAGAGLPPRSWRPPHATAPTCGADLSETAWTSSPCC